MKSRRTALRGALALVMLLGAATLLWRAFSGIDVRGTLVAVGHAGRFAPAVLVPFIAAMTLDAYGISVLLGPLGRGASFAKLVAIRVATEALHLTAPAGFVVADSATAALLDARCGVPLAEGGVLAVARKWLVMRAHAAYIVLGAALGAGVLTGVSRHALGGGWLPWAVAASALVPLSLSLALGAGFRGRPLVLRLQGALSRVPWRALRSRVTRWRSTATTVDGRLATIGAARGATWAATASFFVCWMFESLETMLIVKLVGGPFSLGFAMAAEVGVSLIRSIGNVAPAGLGVQDAGYAVLFRAMGLPADSAAAFVLLKRGKEFVWIAAGYGLLGLMRGKRLGATLDGGVGGALDGGVGGALDGGVGGSVLGGVAGAAPLRTIFGQDRGAAPSQPAV